MEEVLVIPSGMRINVMMRILKDVKSTVLSGIPNAAMLSMLLDAVCAHLNACMV